MGKEVKGKCEDAEWFAGSPLFCTTLQIQFPTL